MGEDLERSGFIISITLVVTIVVNSKTRQTSNYIAIKNTSTSRSHTNGKIKVAVTDIKVHNSNDNISNDRPQSTIILFIGTKKVVQILGTQRLYYPYTHRNFASPDATILIRSTVLSMTPLQRVLS